MGQAGPRANRRSRLTRIGRMLKITGDGLVSGETLVASVEVTQAGDIPVSDQLDEIRHWLDAEAIRATDLQAVIIGGRAKFTASFASPMDAERFVRRFGGDLT